VVAVAAMVAAAALLWRVRDVPLDLAAGIRIDALSAFFALLVLADLALALALYRPDRSRGHSAMLVLLLASLCTTLTPLLAGGYLLAALLVLVPGGQPARERPRAWRRQAEWLAAHTDRVLWPIAGASLLLAYGTLALRGAMRYSDPTAGAALDSFVFWFVLLAAVTPLFPFGRARRGDEAAASFRTRGFAFAWCYPLLRLYSLGPWNTGWSLAAMLLGGALAGWCALSAFAGPRRQKWLDRNRTAAVGLALAGIGLGTSAGIAAACFALLAQLVLALDPAEDGEAAPADASQPPASVFLGWLFGGIFPFTAPFVAVWLLLSASIAAGVALLAGVVWLVGLLNGLAFALWGGMAASRWGRRAIALASISLLLGIGAPLVLHGAIQPVVAQLQGGLSPYGDIAIWPWVGLGANDAARGQVATMPSIAIALLMLVLAALVYVVGRLYAVYGAAPPARPGADGPADEEQADLAARLHDLRAEVPWLGVLLGARSQSEDAPRDPK
jgi:hypothetical protein